MRTLFGAIDPTFKERVDLELESRDEYPLSTEEFLAIHGKEGQWSIQSCANMILQQRRISRGSVALKPDRRRMS